MHRADCFFLVNHYMHGKFIEMYDSMKQLAPFRSLLKIDWLHLVAEHLPKYFFVVVAEIENFCREHVCYIGVLLGVYSRNFRASFEKMKSIHSLLAEIRGGSSM